MQPAIIIGLGAIGAAAAWFALRRNSASNALPAGTLPTSNPFATPLAAKSGIGNEWDQLISLVASREGVDPALLKAIVKKESGFDEEAVNPERSFFLYGKSYGPGDLSGRRALHDFIAGGGDPASIGLNPSLGLAQVRVSIGKKFIPGLDAIQLFDPQTNLTASARLLRQLAKAGITLDTIDAYNVGQDLSPRNLPYRDEVRANYALFVPDFQ